MPQFRTPTMPAADAKTLGVTDLEQRVLAVFQAKPRTRSATVRVTQRIKYLAGGMKATVITKETISGEPRYYDFVGHEVDNHWGYPKLSTIVVGDVAGIEVSHAEYVAALT